MKSINVLFVCTGNICRSPTAEGIFAQLVHERGHAERITVDSAGIADEHEGQAPDPRTQRTALKHGLDISPLRARPVRKEDYERFDYFIAMDHGHLRVLRMGMPVSNAPRLHLFTEFAPHRKEREVADPYYGGPKDFEHVFDLCREAAEGLLAAIVNEHFASKGI